MAGVISGSAAIRTNRGYGLVASGRVDQPSGGLSISLFGPFAIAGQGGHSLTPRGRRACALIAFLILSPSRSAPRERLAEMFWGGRGEDQARASLRQCLAEIRTALRGAVLIEADRDRVWTNPDGYTTDYDIVIAALETGSIGDALAALRRLPGMPLLDGLKATPEFGDWLRDTGERLARQLHDAVLSRIRREAAGGDSGDARSIADAYLDLSPDAEAVVAVAMECDLAAGDRVAAMRRYERLRSYLARELDVAPGAAVVRIHEAMASDAAMPAVIDRSESPPLVLVPAFENAAPDRDSYLPMALREEILAGLSRFRDIRLSSDERRSIADALSPAEAARGYQIVGTLLMAGDGWKLIVRVTHLAERRVIWAETLELGDQATATRIATIVRRIIGMVLPAVNDDYFQRLPPVASAMYDRYLVAKNLSYHAKSLADMREAAGELESIIADVPGFAPAYPPLIRLLNTDFYYTGLGSTGRAERQRAFELARTALQLDPHDVHGHTVLGFCHLWFGREQAARERFAHALSLNPFHAVRVSEVATGYMYLGELDRADELLERSLELKFGADHDYHEDAARLCLLRDDPAKALRHVEDSMAPTLWTRFYACIAWALSGHDFAAPFRVWRDEIEARWHGVQTLDDAVLVDWIHRHHPFSEPVAGKFRTMVARLF